MAADELEELSGILLDHARRYPLMGPADAVKLVYQNEFGGGHLIADPAASLEVLRTEAAAVPPDPTRPLAEALGNGLVRILLGSGEDYPLELLNRDFVRSARRHTGTAPSFLKKIERLKAMAGEGVLPFSAGALEEYWTAYRQDGCPPVSHSAAYRRAYRPAYRVVERSASLPLLLREIRQLSGRQERVIVALDGRCASGKTTLAARLKGEHGWSVVHMDHFFLRPEQRSKARYDTPGENIDHERFLQEVLIPLRRGETAVYRPFDCHTQQLTPPVRVESAPVTIVEGSYACNQALWDQYDLRVFLTVEPEEQLRRITARNGPAYAQVFRERWIPLEELYFSKFALEQRCAYCLEL